MNRMMFWLNTVIGGVVDLIVEAVSLVMHVAKVYDNEASLTCTASVTGGDPPYTYTFTHGINGVFGDPVTVVTTDVSVVVALTAIPNICSAGSVYLTTDGWVGSIESPFTASYRVWVDVLDVDGDAGASTKTKTVYATGAVSGFIDAVGTEPKGTQTVATGLSWPLYAGFDEEVVYADGTVIYTNVPMVPIISPLDWGEFQPYVEFEAVETPLSKCVAFGTVEYGTLHTSNNNLQLADLLPNFGFSWSPAQTHPGDEMWVHVPWEYSGAGSTVSTIKSVVSWHSVHGVTSYPAYINAKFRWKTAGGITSDYTALLEFDTGGPVLHELFDTDDAAPITNNAEMNPGPGHWVVESDSMFISGGMLYQSTNVDWTGYIISAEGFPNISGTKMSWKTVWDASNFAGTHGLRTTSTKATGQQALGLVWWNRECSLGLNGKTFRIDRCANPLASTEAMHAFELLPGGGAAYFFKDAAASAWQLGFYTKESVSADGLHMYVQNAHVYNNARIAGMYVPAFRGEAVGSSVNTYAKSDFDGTATAVTSVNFGTQSIPIYATENNSGKWNTDGSGKLVGTGDGNRNIFWIPGAAVYYPDIGSGYGTVLTGRVSCEGETAFGVVFRVKDANNFQYVAYNWATGTWYYGKVVAGVDTNITSWAGDINGGGWSYGNTRNFLFKMFRSNFEAGDKLQYWIEHQPDAYHRITNEHYTMDTTHNTSYGIGLMVHGAADVYWDEVYFNSTRQDSIDGFASGWV